MHMTDVNTGNSKTQTAVENQQENYPAFREFSWLEEEARNPDRALLCFAKDIAGGVSLTMKLLERSSIDRGNSDTKAAYIDPSNHGILERFCISACDLLGRAIDERIDWIKERAAGEVK